MTNKSILTDYNYNLSKVISPDIIENPTLWLSNFNDFLGGYFIVSMLAVFLIILFIIMRKNDNVSDIQAAVYSSYISAIVGLLLFVVSAVSTAKLLTWPQYVPFLVIAGISILAHFITIKYLD